MVEMLLIVIYLTIITFAALQLVIMVTNDLSMNEAAFALSRVAIVSKTRDVEFKIKKASLIFSLKDVYVTGLNFLLCDLSGETKRAGQEQSHGNVRVYNMDINYIQCVMFGSLLSGSRIASAGTNNMIRSTSCSRMVKSPEEDYYDKAYPCAGKF